MLANLFREAGVADDQNKLKGSQNNETLLNAVLDNEEESNIPLHRIKKVIKNNEIIWERK
jgi:uncharacterized protein (UPF0248 family)